MTDQPGLCRPGRIEQRGGPVGHGADVGEKCTARASMARQIRRQHAKTVMGKPPGMQRPGGMIEAGAVQQHDGRQAHIEFAAAGGDEAVYSVH